MRWFSTLTILAMGFLQFASCARVLFLTAACVKSQKILYSAIADSLADNGHEVTLVSPFEPSEVKPNVREIALGNDFVKYLPDLFKSHRMAAPFKVLGLAHIICADALEHPQLQELLKEEFDVAIITIFFSDCLLSVPYQLKIPVIYVNPASVLLTLFDIVGNPRFPSFAGSPLLGSSHPLTFTQRFASTFVNTFFATNYNYILLPNMERECRRRGLCPEDMPSLVELRQNVSLLLTNGVKEIESPVRPSVPAVIHIGGIHCRESQPLPQDLKEWIEGSRNDGFIFFSLGSVVKPSSMPEEYRKVLLEVFGSLKQRVLWKWDQETMEDLPPNVRLAKWVPQQDILGDPKLQVFITHGGMLSTQEAMYHGVPVLGLPVFGDQKNNMYDVQRQGWGKVLAFDQLTKDNLREAIHSLVTDERYRKTVRRYSEIMRDQPMSPRDTANFWVEYVVRHKGAPHMRSPITDMAWYQLYNVDVWLTVLMVLGAVIYIFLRLLCFLCTCLFFSKRKSKKD